KTKLRASLPTPLDIAAGGSIVFVPAGRSCRARLENSLLPPLFEKSPRQWRCRRSRGRATSPTRSCSFRPTRSRAISPGKQWSLPAVWKAACFGTRRKSIPASHEECFCHGDSRRPGPETGVLPDSTSSPPAGRVFAGGLWPDRRDDRLEAIFDQPGGTRPGSTAGGAADDLARAAGDF